MGKYKDPVTGEIKDDGMPDPAGISVGALFPAKPEHEVTVTKEQRTPSVQSQAAASDELGARADVLNSMIRDTDVATEDAKARIPAADQSVDLLQKQKDAERDAEAERQRVVGQHRQADDQEIEQARKAKVAAGSARADFWKGNTSGEILAHILRGIDRAASSFRGETGPTGVDRVIEAKIADHERKVVGEWEATKEANDLKRTNRAAYLQELDRRRIQAANQSMLELKLVEARTDKALAALGPERAKAAGETKTAAFQHGQALLERTRAEGYDGVTRRAETNRSPTATAGSNRPISAETREIAAASEEYGRLQARQKALVAKHGGFPPLDTEDGQEFDTNDKALATILQKPLGKSDSDADKAADLQNAPGRQGRILQALGRKQGVKNYLTSLSVNSDRLSKDAATKLSLEGRAAPPTTTPADAGPKAEYQQLIKKAQAAGDKATVDALTKEMNAL